LRQLGRHLARLVGRKLLPLVLGRHLVLVGMLAATLWAASTIVGQLFIARDLSAQRVTVEADLAHLNYELALLKQEIAAMSHPEMIAVRARDTFGYAQEGELLFAVVGERVAQAAPVVELELALEPETPAAAPTPSPLDELWMWAWQPFRGPGGGD
jgi:cell division protein FtsB